ncbi:hypothetical protein SteCoe_11467 [Stentor coeruleus]|uniref:Uncharacterized protein n=1 Tax=Stentor coeruleus TaxID=5963 RepID=A0A1R2CD57_9CILI|nr:hypothetical protein SteCoe_11467 [Stentor coeruleus]
MDPIDPDKALDVCFSDSTYHKVPHLATFPIPESLIVDQPPLPKPFTLPDFYIKTKNLSNHYIKYEPSNHDLNYYNTEKPEIHLRNFEKFIGIWEKSSNLNKAISKDKALSFCNFQDKTSVEEIYEYWLTRRNKLGFPLTRGFWKSQDRTDENLGKVFCKRKGGKMKLRNIKEREVEGKFKIQRFYCNLEECKEILIWVLRRELIKFYILKLIVMEFDYKRSEKFQIKYSHPDFEQMIRSGCVDQSFKYRSLDTYLNHYAKMPPAFKIN